MTTIQEQSILPGLKKQDLIIVSETGTGKTLSYLLPILNNINLNIRKIQSIIIAPTKELVRQIYNILLKFKSYNQQLNISILSNDSNITKLFNSHILVSTPSNVTNLINKQIDTNIISSIVLDEADLLIDYGFKNTIINIFNNIKNKNIQKIVCSATFHETLSNQIKTYLNKPLIISTSKNI
jgi:ATP-dependent RNA helicase CshB